MAKSKVVTEPSRLWLFARWRNKIKAWYDGLPSSSFAQCVSASCACLMAAAACFGVYTFFRSVSVEQLKQAELAISRLYPLDVDINQTLGRTPLMREALYCDPRGHVFRQLGEEEKSLFKEACGELGDLFEYFLLIRNRMT